MQANFQNKNFKFSEFKKLNQKSFSQIKKFYKKLVLNYINLDRKFKFSEELDKKYIFKQIKNIYKKKNGKLNFIPIGIKDNINTLNLDTKFGLKSRKNFRSGNDARVVSKIIDNSGIIFSKLTCAEFAVHFIDKKKRANPLNKNFISGTSSTGSAVSVAVGALPVALGTQTAGSILRPSSYCGVIGFKPTYGSIDRIGVLKTNDLSDTVGIISNDIKFVQETFKSVINTSKDYPWTENYQSRFTVYKKKKKFNLGIFNEDFKVYKNFEEEIKKQFSSKLKNLDKKKFKLIKIKNINILNKFHKNFFKVYHSSLSYYLKNINPNLERISGNLKKIVNDGKKVTFVDKQKSTAYLHNSKRIFDKIFKNIDFILIPTTASHAPKFDEKEKEDSCLIWTTFGYPSISLPLFKSKKNNMPFGLQIISNKYCDFSLLDFSKKISSILR